MFSELNLYLLNLNIKITHHPLVSLLLIHLENKYCVWAQHKHIPPIHTQVCIIILLMAMTILYWKMFIYLIYSLALRPLCLWRTVNLHMHQMY